MVVRHQRRHVVALPHEPQAELTSTSTQATRKMQQTKNLDLEQPNERRKLHVWFGGMRKSNCSCNKMQLKLHLSNGECRSDAEPRCNESSCAWHGMARHGTSSSHDAQADSELGGDTTLLLDRLLHNNVETSSIL